MKESHDMGLLLDSRVPIIVVESYEEKRALDLLLRVANQRIGAKAASAAEARLLGERRGAPLLTMVRTAYDDQGKAVEHGSHVYRASHYSLEVTLIER